MEQRRLLWIFVAGGALRLALLVFTPGHPFDMFALGALGQQLSSHPLHLYALNDPHHLTPIWPYPPLYGAVALVAREAARITGLPFSPIVRAPAVCADLAIAVIVTGVLRGRGASFRTQAIAAALLSLGPVPIFDSAVHGQIDAAAFLPALVAVVVFRSERPHRYVEAGVLLGVAIAIKQPTAIVLLGLVVLARSWRTAFRLTLPAVAIPVLLTVPFALAEPAGARVLVRYGGVLGFGGLTLIAHPALAASRIIGTYPEATQLDLWLLRHAGLAVVISLIAVAVFLRRRDATTPELAVAVLVAAALAVMPASGPWYFSWVVPFLILSRRAGWAAVLEGILLVPMCLLYRNLLAAALPGSPTLALGPRAGTYVYAPLVVSAAAVCAAFVVTRLWNRDAATVPSEPPDDSAATAGSAGHVGGVST